MRIVVLMGGSSPEAGVSVKSGRAVEEALRRIGLDVEALLVEEESLEWFGRHIPLDRDVYFIAMHGGRGEDGTVQQICEDLGLCYTGSGPLASRMAMDKVLFKDFLVKNGLPTPEFMVLGSVDELEFPGFGLPVVVKPVDSGSSIGLSVVFDEDDLARAVEEAFSVSDRVLLERFIEGREMTVGILGREAFEVIEIRPKKRRFFDYESKYKKGATEYLLPAMIDADTRALLRSLARDIFDFLGLRDFARIDIMWGKDNRPYVLEANSIPGMTETSLLPMAARFAGIDFPELCLSIVEMAGRRCGKEKEAKE